jgi:DNA-directed RNA polymerase specialized sigma24 family protein
MSSAGSVSHWISLLKAGDHLAAQPLWEGYFQRLVRLARSRLQGSPRRAADEEDVALSAFESFCRRAEQGRFPQLADRDDLWQLLVVLTVRKAIKLREHENRQKRGGGRVFDESALRDTESSLESVAGLDNFVGPEPTPAFAAQVAEECERLLALLDSDEQRSLALWKMEGYTNDEIAEKLGCVARTVKRKLYLIRNIWSQEVGS